MKLGELVKERRVKIGLSQMGFAEVGGFTHSLITALEGGRRRYMRGSEIDQLALALGMSEQELWDLLGLDRDALLQHRYVKVA